MPSFVHSKFRSSSVEYDIEYGRLKMPGSESLILAQRTMCLKRLFEDYASNWIAFFQFLHIWKSRRKANFAVPF